MPTERCYREVDALMELIVAAGEANCAFATLVDWRLENFHLQQGQEWQRTERWEHSVW